MWFTQSALTNKLTGRLINLGLIPKKVTINLTNGPNNLVWKLKNGHLMSRD